MHAARNLRPGDRIRCNFPQEFGWDTALVISVTPAPCFQPRDATTMRLLEREAPYIGVLTDKTRIIEYTAFWIKANCIAFNR